MSDIENVLPPLEGMLEVKNDEISVSSPTNYHCKEDMFSFEIAKISLSNSPRVVSKIIIDRLQQISDDPQDSYRQCFREQYIKVGPVGFRNGYQKSC